MPSDIRRHASVPDPGRMTESLRGVGYSLHSAIADVIDNSIEAKASEIDVSFHHGETSGSSNWVRIADNGRSMTADRATEALRYGAELEPDLDRDVYLSAFGFGLKTASTSQCRKVWLAARQNPDRALIHARLLDLDYLRDTGKWETLEYRTGDAPNALVGPLRERAGTVVLWQEIDRILKYADPYGSSARAGVERKFALVEEHLAMVFNRYMSGTTNPRHRKVSISLNGRLIDPWDPFCLDETGPAGTTVCREAELQVPNSRGSGMAPVRVVGYVLPRQEEFSSPEAWNRAAGPKKWNRSQGFYFYRGNRIIQNGGWSRLRTIDEHTKLARVAVEFDHRADGAFDIDIAKGRVSIPDDLKGSIEDVVETVVRAARNRYDRRSRRPGPGPGPGPDPGPGPGPDPGPGPGPDPGPGPGPGPGPDPDPDPDPGPGEVVTIEDAGGAVMGSAVRLRKKGHLDEIIRDLRESRPDVADALGW